MMRSLVLSAVSGLALVSSAFAADIYPGGVSYKETPVLLPVSTWAGFYLGVNGGIGGFNSFEFRDDTFVTANGTDFRRIRGDGISFGGFGGGQLGYNLQAGSFVYGIEADIQGSNIQGKAAEVQVVGTVDRFGTATQNIDFFGTVRGRLGFAWGGTLLYATGGFAYGGVDSSFTFRDSNGALGRVSNSQTDTGWVAGAGVEYKIAPNWSLKGEYQFIDLGTISAERPLISTVSSDHSLRGSENVEFHTVRVGLNYYFNTPYVPLK